MDLYTSEIKELSFDYVRTLVGVYEDTLYYQKAGSLMRINLEGGEEELVVSNIFDVGIKTYFNFANDKLYYLWGNLLYVLPLNQIGVSRHDCEYTEMYPYSLNVPIIEDRGLWIWGDNVWTFVNTTGVYSTTLGVAEGVY